jgi:intein/homing endonuclease
LPNVLDTFLAEDIGVQIGDGSLPVYIDNKGVKHFIIACYGNITEDQKYFKNFIIPLKRKLFNINQSLKYHPIAGTCYIKFESKAIFTFYENVIGLQTGRKDNISIPKIILKAPLEIKLACIRGIADTDFSLVFKKDFKGVHRDPYIELGCSSKILIKQINKILKDITIVSTTTFDSN